MDKGELYAFDLVINVLKEHEKNLENLLSRLESLLETMSALIGAFRVRIQEDRVGCLKNKLPEAGAYYVINRPPELQTWSTAS